MPKEIERKFLIKNDSWRGQDSGKRYRQGYLSTVKERTVRVRTAGDKGFLTIKGITVGASGLNMSMRFQWRTPTKCLTSFANGH